MAHDPHAFEDPRRLKYLTFGLLERFADRSLPALETYLNDAIVKRIGPLVEFVYQDVGRTPKWPSTLGNSRVIDEFERTLLKRSIFDFPMVSTLKPMTVEFIRNFQTADQADDPRWMSFCKRLENAAYSAGAGRSYSQALTGTFEEMVFNIVEHSERPQTAIVGYRWSPGEFEYIVADSGIGVFESLRKNPYYSFLSSSDEALLTTIREGESRHGHNVNRGFGFRDLLNNIINQRSYLRFRSGDHGFIIDGTQDMPVWHTKRCHPLNGFLISLISKT